MTAISIRATETQSWMFPFMALSTFGEWLKSERERRGMSQVMLAERADTTAASISRFESGGRTASRRMVIELAKALKADVNTALVSAGFSPLSESIPPQHLAENLRTLADQLDRGASTGDIDLALSDPDVMVIPVGGFSQLDDAQRSAILNTVEATAKAMMESLKAQTRLAVPETPGGWREGDIPIMRVNLDDEPAPDETPHQQDTSASASNSGRSR